MIFFVTFFVLLSFAFVSLLFQNCSNQGFSSNPSINLTNPTNTPNSNSETCTNNNSCITQTHPDAPINAISDLGWSQVPDSKFSDICRNTQSFFGFTQDCRSIFTAWSSAVADTNKNRLVIFGGGHNDYYGNEVYSFDLMQRKFIRLNDPTPLAAKTTCMTAFPDGRPSSRHSYGGLSFIPDKNKMILFGGSPSCPTGGLASDAWLLDLTSLDRNNPA